MKADILHIYKEAFKLGEEVGETLFYGSPVPVFTVSKGKHHRIMKILGVDDYKTRMLTGFYRIAVKNNGVKHNEVKKDG